MDQTELLELIERSKQGDPDAQSALMQAARNRIYYHCKKMLKNEEDAEDATQDVLIVIFTSLDKLRQPAAFWGWVNGITANRCKHLLSAPHKEWQIPEDEDGNSLLDSIENVDKQFIPEQALEDKETRDMVLGLVEDLPPEQRMSVLYYYYDEMSVKQIAEAMDTSEGTVKSRLNYARKAIKRGAEDYARKGVKLYSVSPLLLLVYFLRMDAEATALSPASAAAIANAVTAATGAGAAGAGAAASGAAAATGTGSTVSGTTAAAAGTGSAASGTTAAAAGTAAKAGGAVSTKLVAGVLAGTVAVGGAGVGISSLMNREPAAEIPPPPAEVLTVDISAGSSTAGFVDADGVLWVWGENVPVDGALVRTAVPTKLMDDVAAVDCGPDFCVAVKTDGSLWGWGANQWDQLGLGRFVYSAETPAKILDDVVSVSCGYGQAAAVTTDGSLWGWGTDDGRYGLGDGSRNGSYTTVKIMDDVAAVDCGTYGGAIIKTDGSLWMWGPNKDGQLGTGDTTGTRTPVKVMDDVVAVSCGGAYMNNFTAAICSDGSLWMWGSNQSGQLGDGTGEDSLVPIKIMDDVAAVSCSHENSNFTAALKTDGSLWMWGYNLGGRLGNGTSENSLVPIKVMDDVTAVSCGTSTTVAVKSDGSVWAWGGNFSGILGGAVSRQGSRVPVQVQFEEEDGAAAS